MVKTATKIDKLLTNIEKPVMFVSALALFTIMCLAVITRIFGISAAYQSELTKLFHIWMCFFGASYLLGTDGHPAVELFIDKVKARPDDTFKKVYMTITYAIILIFLIPACWYAIKQIPMYSRQVTTYLSLSYLWVYGGGILGLILLFIRCIVKTLFIWGEKEA